MTRTVSPFLYYLFSQITGGVFVLVWIVRMMKSVNALEDDANYFNDRLFEILFGVLFFVQIVLVALTVVIFSQRGGYHFVVVCLFINTISFFSVLIYSLIALYKATVELRGEVFDFYRLILALLMTLFMFSIAPIIQRNINILLKKSETS